MISSDDLSYLQASGCQRFGFSAQALISPLSILTGGFKVLFVQVISRSLLSFDPLDPRPQSAALSVFLSRYAVNRGQPFPKTRTQPVYLGHCALIDSFPATKKPVMSRLFLRFTGMIEMGRLRFELRSSRLKASCAHRQTAWYHSVSLTILEYCLEWDTFPLPIRLGQALLFQLMHGTAWQINSAIGSFRSALIFSFLLLL